MQTEVIWEGFRKELLKFIKARVNEQDEAEDILQEVFIKIHLNIKSIQEKAKISSWVYAITRNAIIDYYRKRKRMDHPENFELQLEEELEESKQDFSSCLTSFIEQLPEKDQEALNKTAFGNVSQKEYAKELQLSYSATKSRVQRAREKLKDLFVACCAIETDHYGNIISSKEEDCNC